MNSGEQVPHLSLNNNPNGSTLETTNKIPPENVIIEENLENYHQTKGAFPLLDEPSSYIDIRTVGEITQVEAIIDGAYVFPEIPNKQ